MRGTHYCGNNCLCDSVQCRARRLADEDE
jgi:hypothetical protein